MNGSLFLWVMHCYSSKTRNHKLERAKENLMAWTFFKEVHDQWQWPTLLTRTVISHDERQGNVRKGKQNTHMLSFSMLYSILKNHLYSKNKGQKRDKQKSPDFTRENGGIKSSRNGLFQGPKEWVRKERDFQSFFHSFNTFVFHACSAWAWC